jgi:mono/diheme cytochrome c family protein
MARKARIAAAAGVVAALGVVALAILPLDSRAAPYTPMTAPVLSMRALTQPISDGTPDAPQIRLGQYLVRVGDCASCHTREGGAFLAGGRALNTPFGSIYSTNLTSDRETGVGDWTADEFYSALHDGTQPRAGGPLYPAMPYPYTTRVTRVDSDAILAFLKTVAPVNERRPPNALSFPFNIRSLVRGWKQLYFHPGEFRPDASKSADWNRGAYLVTGLGHCGACHTPKNALGADRTGQPLQGGTLDNWVAPDLSANTRTGIGSWSVDDIVDYLRTGRNTRGNAGGAMAAVVSYSTSLLTDADLHAIANYLKEQSAAPDAKPDAPDAGAMRRGGAVFSDACTACHMEEGLGQARLFPPLRANAVAQQADPTGALHIILAGDRTAVTSSRPTPLSMPSFAWKLTDQEIADVATYVRNSWGNRAQPVSAKQVDEMRRKLGLQSEYHVGRSTSAARK